MTIGAGTITMDPDATVYAVIDRRVGGPVHINNNKPEARRARARARTNPKYPSRGLDVRSL